MAAQKEPLLVKLDELEARFSEIEKQIADPRTAKDSAKLIVLSKEQARLRPIVAKYRQYKQTQAGIADAELVLKDEALEHDFRDLAKEEVGQLNQRKQTLLEEIKNSLVTAEDDAISSVIMEIRAGTGGAEAALFARDLYNMYVRYAESQQWRVEQLDFSPAEMGGFREVIFNIKGPGVWSQLGYEGGGHRVQRVPVTESQGRLHTSAATVAVLPEPEEVEVEIKPEDVVEHVSRAGGPGGQNVNKVSSAIRLEHVPTGITVSMRNEQSQHKNRAKAWRVLRSRLYEHYEKQKRAERDSKRKTMIGSGDRSQKIRTYNFPQNRVTDHRINLSLHSLDRILAGDMGELIAALQEHGKQQRLESL